jgi:hypothetical protein
MGYEGHQRLTKTRSRGGRLRDTSLVFCDPNIAERPRALQAERTKINIKNPSSLGGNSK